MASTATPTPTPTAAVTVQPASETKKENDAPLYFPHFRVLSQFKYHKCVLREFDSMKCDGAPILLGFPGDGITSPLCANYLIDKLNLPLIGDIESVTLPLTCVVSRFIPARSIRLFGDSRVVVVTAEQQLPLDQDPQAADLLFKSICEAILDFAKRHRSAFILAVEGIRQEDEDKVQVAVPIDEESGGVNPDDLADTLIESLAQKRIKGKKHGKEKDKEKDKKEEVKEDKNAKHADKDKKKDKKGKDADKAKDSSEERRKALEEEDVKRLLFLSNKQEIGAELASRGHEPLESGVFQGVTGCLLLEAPFTAAAVVLLCAEFKKIDAKAAEPIVCEVAKLLHVELDLSDLHERMSELQSELTKILESLAEKDQPSGQAASMYI